MPRTRSRCLKEPRYDATVFFPVSMTAVGPSGVLRLVARPDPAYSTAMTTKGVGVTGKDQRCGANATRMAVLDQHKDEGEAPRDRLNEVFRGELIRLPR